MSATDRSNVNDAAVVDYLEERLLASRAPEEAFGELLWRNRLLLELDLLSKSTAAGIDSVGEAWLREKVGDEALAAARSLAGEYASFVAERVDLRDPYAMYAPQLAWSEWRSRRRG